MSLPVGHAADPQAARAVTNLASSPVLAELRATFEEFGLNGYEAQVLLALLQLGSATARELARVADVGRTHVYPVLEALRERGVARQLGGKLSVWQSPGREEVLDRLCAIEEERLRSLADRKRYAQQMLDRLASQQAVATPYVHLLSGAAQVAETYKQLLDEAEEEILMFSIEPFAEMPNEPDPVVLRTIARGVDIQVLYVADEYHAPHRNLLRQLVTGYHAAGVQGRLVDELPMKLVISDRRAALHALSDPILPEVGFPTSQLTRHPGYASFLAMAFDSSWAASRPIER